MSEYLPWIGFHIFIVIAMALDLGVFHRKDEVVRLKEALTWSAIWFIAAIIFGCGMYYFKGSQAGLEYFAGYILEWSLSVDNLFVFITIFSAFAVPHKLQHRVLFWGIIGAVILRAAVIFAGVALLQKFDWILYVFGAFLIFTGFKIAFFESDEEMDAKNHWMVKLSRRWLPFTDEYHDRHFAVKVNGRWVGTPLLLVLIVIDVADVIFAADSIPAIFAITRDPFVVYTSNIFAILGLRNLYFAIAGMMTLFRYLNHGLAAVLIFIGVKLLIVKWVHIPIGVSLGAIGVFMGLAIVLSVLVERRERRNGSTSQDDK